MRNLFDENPKKIPAMIMKEGGRAEAIGKGVALAKACNKLMKS